MAEILVVEDEPAIAESVTYALGKAGFIAVHADTLQKARVALEESPRLIILDLMLPDGSGFDLIEELSAKSSSAPAIIVLSSRDAEADRVRALESGADDYVVKPFSPREIVARARAVLRRTTHEQEAGTQRLQLSTDTRRVSVDDTLLDLTRVEFDLLALMMTKPGHVFSRALIIDEVWGTGFALSDRTIDSHIKALRRKLSDAGGESGWIETERGVGYRILEPEHWGERANAT